MQLVLSLTGSVASLPEKKSKFRREFLQQLLQRLVWADNEEEASQPDCDLYFWTHHPKPPDALHYWYEILMGVSQSEEFLLREDVLSKHRLYVHICFLVGQNFTPGARRLHYFGHYPSKVYPIQNYTHASSKSLTGSGRRNLFPV